MEIQVLSTPPPDDEPVLTTFLRQGAQKVTCALRDVEHEAAAIEAREDAASTLRREAVPPWQTLDEQFPSPWSAAQTAGGGGGRPPFSFTSPIRGASDFAAGVKRSSRLPAPFMMGIGVAVRETLSMRSQTVTGRARSVSDGRAISRQRADLRRVQPMFDDSPSTPRGRSASTLT